MCSPQSLEANVARGFRSFQLDPEVQLFDEERIFEGPLVPGLKPMFIKKFKREAFKFLPRPISYADSLAKSRSLLSKIGVKDPNAYGEHSGRRGGATAAAGAGMSLEKIKRHGRWRSLSMPQEYIDEELMFTQPIVLDL